jgi:hypothetical protein
MTHGHRRWHRRIWLTLGPLTVAALIGSLWFKPVDSQRAEIPSGASESKP